MPIPQDELDRYAVEEAWASDFGPDHGDHCGAWEPPPSANGQSHAAPKEPASSLPLVYYRDIRPALDAADFVEGLLIDCAMSVIYGESGCGKTFFALDLALHVAAGLPWRGREVEKGGVLYLALEGSHGISNRVAAFKKANLAGDADLPFAVVPVSVNLLDPAGDVVKVIESAKEAAASLRMPVRLIVIDTLSRALAGGNENDPKDMGTIVRNIDHIRQQLPAHVSTIHHSGKDGARGARGHSLLRAAADTEIEVTRDPSGKTSIARVTKQRELDCDGEFPFRLESVALGINRRGKPVTSCVVRVIDAEDLAAQAEAVAAEKATMAAEKKAAADAAKARVQDAISTAVAAQKLAANAERVLAAIDAICVNTPEAIDKKPPPAATKRKIRLMTSLKPDPLDEALRHLIDAGKIEPIEFTQASGNGATKPEDGYRRVTPVTPVPTVVPEGGTGVGTTVDRVLGNAGANNAGAESPPLRGLDGVGTVVHTPCDSAKSTGTSTFSNPSEGETRTAPKTSPDKPAPRKPNRRRAAAAKPRLFVEPAMMPD